MFGIVYISHHLSSQEFVQSITPLEWCGTVPSLAGMGQCLSRAVLQLCPHGHDVQEAAGTRSEGDVCTLAACTF